MPLTELEQHPFLDYHEAIPPANRPAYEGLVIGSFPIYAITDSVDAQLEVVAERFNANAARMKFFYSSVKSDFWQYISAAHDDLVNPVLSQPGDVNELGIGSARQRCIDFLVRHKLLMTDVIYRTNRKGQGSEDSELWQAIEAPAWLVPQLQLNHNLPVLLQQNPGIKNQYFTSTVRNGNSPFVWFQRIFGNQLTEIDPYWVGGRIWSSICIIDGRLYNAFFLPTPKPRGVHFGDNQQLLQFVNYLLAVDDVFYHQIAQVPIAQRTPAQKQALSQYRLNFLVECYRQAFIYHNRHFTGNVN